jgi:hypothetical protein
MKYLNNSNNSSDNIITKAMIHDMFAQNYDHYDTDKCLYLNHWEFR